MCSGVSVFPAKSVCRERVKNALNPTQKLIACFVKFNFDNI